MEDSKATEITGKMGVSHVLPHARLIAALEMQREYSCNEMLVVMIWGSVLTAYLQSRGILSLESQQNNRAD
jgi:hypothetical protein